jgi:hypothetical protein
MNTTPRASVRTVMLSNVPTVEPSSPTKDVTYQVEEKVNLLWNLSKIRELTLSKSEKIELMHIYWSFYASIFTVEQGCETNYNCNYDYYYGDVNCA